MNKLTEKALLWVLLLFAGFWPILGATQEIVPSAKWALVVGVAEYPGLFGVDLTYTAIDAQAIYRFLIGPGGLEEDHVKLLLNDEATLSGVRGGLQWLEQRAQPDDLVIFYFSGHGYQGNDDNGDETDETDEFLVLYDTQQDLIESTAFRDDEIAEWSEALLSRIDSVLWIIDSSYSGGIEASDVLMAGCTENELDWEDPALGHGVFTYFLLQGLNGEADKDKDYNITVEELHDYVSREVDSFVEREKGASQRPQLIGNGRLGVIVATMNHPPQADFAWDPQEGIREGSEVAFHDASVDQDGHIAEWRWNLGDGSISTDANPTHRYTREGTFTVTLTVTDNDGLTDGTTKTIVVKHKDLIQPDFTFQVVDEKLHKIHLDANTSIDTMGTIVRYEWDWNGDGVYDTAVEVPEMTHRFDEEGPYQVILTIVDDQGNRASCTKEVTP